MALKALMLKKKIDQKRAERDAANQRLMELREEEKELEQAIEEAAEMEEGEEKKEAQKTIEEKVEEFEEKKKAAEEEAEKLENEVSDLEKELENEEKEQETPVEEAPVEERKETKHMENREKFFGMNAQERDMFFAREDVKNWLGEVRSAIKEKRALNNVGVLVPEVFLGLLRENIMQYSKLYKHVDVRRINGDGRLAIMSAIPEAIWTECCANLNELSLTFYDLEVDCYKCGGFFAICNSSLADSDIALATELMTALGQSIGKALDKAILYGKNTAANQKMPLGIVSRLCQTAQPSGYPATARPWVDLSSTNVLSIPAGTEGAALIKAIATDFAAAKGSYSRGEKVFCMNEKTYTLLGTSTIVQAADGSIVSGVLDRMPVVGGIIEVLDFIPDNVIIGGYFDLYLLGERAGNAFATSEHVRFLADQTVMKGTARYDGAPEIAEAFVAIGLNGVTPNETMVFAADTANQGG